MISSSPIEEDEEDEEEEDDETDDMVICKTMSIIAWIEEKSTFSNYFSLFQNCCD